MKKRMILLAAVLFLLIVPNIVSSARIEAGIVKKLNDEQEVSVIIILKDELAAPKGLSALNMADANQILEQKKAMVRRQQDKVLSNLNLNGTENLIKSAGAKGSVSKPSPDDFNLKHKYSTVNGFSGIVTESGLEKLRNNPDVKGVYLNKLFHTTLDQSIPQINADDVWPIQLSSINITGLDETICIIDTGIDYNYPSLGEGWGNKIIGGYNEITLQDCSVNNSACLDDNGHGTHCAGIAASENETYKGVAPDAKLIAIKALDSDGEGWEADIIAGIDWCVNNAPQFNISVISLSSGIEGTAYNNYCDADYSDFAYAINSAVGEGIVVTIASGNCKGVDCIAGISAPSCIQNATPVGSVNNADIIGFQRGDILNLLAPGYSICSTRLPEDNYGLVCGDGTFISKSGTSMSAPHVAGVAALLKQFVRLYNGTDITPDEIENILNNTGTEINDTSGSGRNYSRIDIYSAILSLDTDKRLTVQADNTAPTIIANATSPTTVYTNTDFNFNMTATDSENATFTGYVQFYINSTASGSIQSQAMNNNTNTLIGTLGSGNFSKNYNLTAEFWAGDETYNTTKTNTTIITVNNSIPTQPSLTNPANTSYINTTITMNWTASTDADLDTVYYYVLVNGTQACYTTNLNCSYSPEDAYYEWNVTAYDGSENSTSSNSRYYTHDTTPPTPSNIGRNDSNVCVNETVLFYASWSDSIGLSHYIFGWNNSGVMENNSAQTLTTWSNITREVNATNHSIVKWVIYANDSAGNWNSTGIQIFKVGNSAPTQPNLTSPANNSYTNTTPITMNWTASADADNNSIYYYVLINGTQACYTNNTNCSYNPTEAYYEWHVTPNDGAENGTSSSSGYYTYDITKPSITDVSTEDLTSGSVTLTAVTNENADCAYATTNIVYSQMIAFDTTGGTSHSTPLSGLSASTSYTYYVRCKDTAGNVMTTSSSETFTTSSSSGSSGGSGGSSSVSYEQKSLGTLAAGSSKKVTFLESDTHGVTEIEVKVKNKVTNAKIKVDAGSLPSGASLPSTKGSVYKYIEITKVDLTDDDIEKAVIEFKVKRSWLTDKGYGIDAVSLHRYYNKKWEKLETTRTGFSAEYYYYSAKPTGFSTFAITAEKALPAPTTIKVTEKIAEEESKEKITEEEPNNLSEEESIFSRLRFNLKDIKFNINWVWTTIIVITLSVIYFAQKKWNLLKISVGMESEAIIVITTKMKKAEKLIEEGNVDSAKKTYKKILKIYDGLPVNEKKWVYKEIQSLYSKIKGKGS